MPLSILLLRLGSVSCILGLAALSWLPGDAIVRTSMGGHVEHVIAYVGTTIIVVLTLQPSVRLDVQCGTLIGYAAVLEAGQRYVPGRHASMEDFAFSVIGIGSGGLLSWYMRFRLR
jgi:VanZ family protein